MRTAVRLVVVVAVTVAVAALGGCAEPEGPALEVFLQLVRAGADVDTSDITGFSVTINGEETRIGFDDGAQVPIELTAAPAPDTEIVVLGCTINAQCEDRFGVFAGCAVEDLGPSSEPIALTIALDVRSSTGVPASCEGLVDPLPAG